MLLQGDSPQARQIAAQLKDKLHNLKDILKSALIGKVVDDFADINTPLKQFVEAVIAPEGTPNREGNLNDKARNLQDHSLRAANTGRMVAMGGGCKDKKTVEALNQAANQVMELSRILFNSWIELNEKKVQIFFL